MSASIGFNAQNQFTVGGTALDYGRNFIINGGFDYWNYATSQTTSGYGSDDRWMNGNSGSTKTHSQAVSTDTERALFNSSNFSRTVVTSVAGVANYCIKKHKIENVTKLAGKTITISFKGKVDSPKNIAIELEQDFGTGGTPSAKVISIGSQHIPLVTTWGTKSVTITLPSIIGKTLGTDGVHTSYTDLIFWFDAGSNYNANTASLGQQSGTFEIAEVKLEEGSVATPWTPYEGEFGGEVQACQRYYQLMGGIRLHGWAGQATQELSQTLTIPQMRTVPTWIRLIAGAYVNVTGSISYMTNWSDSSGSYRIVSVAAGVCTVSNETYAASAEL